MGEASETARDNGHAVLVPGREVQLSNGGVVWVRPLTFTQLAKGGMHIEKVIRPALEHGIITAEGDIDLSNLLGFITAVGGHVNELLLLTTYGEDGQRVGREWFEETVQIEDGLELTSAFIKENWREDVAKKLASLNQEVQAILTGLTPSTG